MDGIVVYILMNSYRYEHQVPFQDTDMAGVVHYTCILGYIELAEHAKLASAGIEVISSKGGLPKVHVSCDYLSPLRFGDLLEVELLLVRCSAKSLHWSFIIRCNNKDCAKGEMVTAYVDERGKSIRIPKEWDTLLA